jgi:hypothetical protein
MIVRRLAAADMAAQGYRRSRRRRVSLARTEVTVTLDFVADGDEHTLTLVLPSFRSDDGEETFCTFAVITTNRSSFAGPPIGPGQTYEVVALDGVARAVDF